MSVTSAGVHPGELRHCLRTDCQATFNIVAVYRDDGTGDPAVVRSGARPTWDTARQDGQVALLDAKRAATDEDNSGTVTLPVTGAGLSQPGIQPGH